MRVVSGEEPSAVCDVSLADTTGVLEEPQKVLRMRPVPFEEEHRHRGVIKGGGIELQEDRTCAAFTS